jgi:hypothetical protein
LVLGLASVLTIRLQAGRLYRLAVVCAVLGLSANAPLRLQSNAYEDKVLLQVEDRHYAKLCDYVVRKVGRWRCRREAKSKTKTFGTNKQSRTGTVSRLLGLATLCTDNLSFFQPCVSVTLSRPAIRNVYPMGLPWPLPGRRGSEGPRPIRCPSLGPLGRPRLPRCVHVNSLRHNSHEHGKNGARTRSVSR